MDKPSKEQFTQACDSVMLLLDKLKWPTLYVMGVIGSVMCHVMAYRYTSENWDDERLEAELEELSKHMSKTVKECLDESQE